LKNINGLFLLTLNDSSNIRKIFHGFYIRGFSLKTKINVQNSDEKKRRKELIITNYKIVKNNQLIL